MSEVEAEGPRRFTLAHLILLVPWVALVIDAWSSITDNSFLWHVRAGTLQIEGVRVLTADPFSFTAGGEAWLTQSWLAELLYGWLEDISGGLGFVPWLLLAITGLTFLGIGLIAYKASGSVLATSVVLILSTVSLISFLVPRPVVFSYLLFVLAILAWERPRSRWSIPFVFWVWASVHGSFFIGLAYIGLRLLSKREWRAMPTAIAAGVATLLTAHGLGVIQMLLDFAAARPYLGLLTEWRTPELLSPVFLPVFIGVVIIIYGAMRQRLVPLDLLVIVPFFALALTALRSVPPAWIALLIPVGAAMTGWGRSLPRRFGQGPALIFAFAVLVIPFFLAEGSGFDDDRFPTSLAAELDEAPVFHDDVVGGYLIWARGPALQVYIDDRAELFQERIEQFVEIRNGREPWEAEFQRFDIDQALLREGEPMIDWLTEAGWASVAEEDGFVLLRSG
ncbi:MAG: hypothetical protein DWQ20_04685 [Actinobacteria bacterium]|nr:MAG: hypothetical protein DWQ20_04685 [Actinomycetota bacterium]